MKISQEALDAARSIGSYCGSRFQQDVSAMLDVPWFAEKVQIAIDASMPAAPTPQPITADWLREQGWEWDDQSQFFFFEAPNLFVIMEEQDGPGNGWTFQLDDWGRPVTDTVDVSNLVNALRGTQ